VYFGEIVKETQFEKNTSHFHRHSSWVWLDFMHHSEPIRKWRLFPHLKFLDFLNLGLPYLLLFLGIDLFHSFYSIKPFNIVGIIINWLVVFLYFESKLWNCIFKILEPIFLEFRFLDFCLNLLIQDHDVRSCGTSGRFFVSLAISLERWNWIILDDGLFIFWNGVEGFLKTCEVPLNHRFKHDIITLETKISRKIVVFKNDHAPHFMEKT
jgi:hypothetical protein